MKLNLKEKSTFLKSLNIVVPWEDLKEEYYKEFKKIKSQYSLQGFRKGKVPDNILRKHAGKSIDSHFVDHATNIYYKEALKELKINPINQGSITSINFEEYSDLKFDIEFEIIPEFKLPNYQKKIKIKTDKYVANDKDVSEALSTLQTQHAKAKSIKGKIKSGHFIYADFNKLDDQNKVDDENALKNHYVKIGEGLFSGKLEKSFLNKAAGDVVDIEVEQGSGLIKYRVKINKIEEQILPELNDDFAKLINNDILNLIELKKNIMENIQNRLNNENQKIYNQHVVEYFIDKTKLEPPSTMVDNYKGHLIEQYKKEYSSKGESYDEKELIENSQETSQKMIKWHLIKQQIIQLEQIKILKSDIDKHINLIIKQNPSQKKEILKYYKDNANKEKIYQDLIEKELFDKLSQYFINTIKEKSTDQLRGKRNKNG